MEEDDSFRTSGTVPFKWEIRPGVPKVRNQQPQSDHHRSFVHHHHRQQSDHQSRSCPSTPQKLRPPPSEFYFGPPPEFRTRSFRSDHFSPGCFPSPLLRRKDHKKGSHKSKPNCTSDLEISCRWSKSTPHSPVPFRDSLSRSSFSSNKSLVVPFCDSLSRSSFSSNKSLTRPVSDAEWAGFGLF